MYQDFLIEFSQLTIKLKKRRKNAYVCGCVHVCMLMRMFAHCVCVCKPKFLPYAIYMVPRILHWLFRSCTVYFFVFFFFVCLLLFFFVLFFGLFVCFSFFFFFFFFICIN